MLKVLKSGLFTAVQDIGRYGYLNKGVPVAGYMDGFSAKKVNQLLDNDMHAAVLEITMTGPTLFFEQETYISMGGALLSATLNNEPVNNYEVIKVKKGDILSYGKLEKGFRNYLAVKGGFKAPLVLGSRSFFSSVTKKNHLADGSELEYDACSFFEPKISKIIVDSFLDEKELKVTKGPEFESLSDKQLEMLFGKKFSISNENNRMAYKLEEKIEGLKTSMITSATLPGTVQLTPSGKLIILMKDGQTTGGYPRILQLSDRAISVLAQKKYGDEVQFKLN
ncbi:5-oxoprolinase subunit C family protein [Zobellia barbeyronii]|uniref:Biotin-dependent carboxyltransferase family protein n=1 Tax=Zobellia barbeyronii TaxID=2748009 RepID=A0ABS5WIP3_9FLAO|nr:biotin-dependent carboxyltransferase family protein [Zobellia barbeyronii]MBT2163034.1 biotin-dependent carboxyltransferase family protein [Zobellia barbeyronii]